MTARLGRESLTVCLLVVAAAYFVLVELHRPALTPAFDIYIYFLPNKLHAVDSVWRGGKGLLWNPYQGCGEPFFANPAMGLLYPPNLLFLLLEPNRAVHVVLIINMVLGAIGMLWLLRALGLDWVAALGGALVFELGSPMAELTGWSPMHNGPWAWLPWALLLCERLLRTPSRAGIIGLAVVLALELLPGWVLITALTYQLIALRVGWELVTRRGDRPWRAAAAVAAGLALAPGLAAIQLVPAAELARQSFRVAVEVGDFARAPMIDMLGMLKNRMPPVPFMVLPLLLAAVAPFVSTKRRLVVFYLLIGCLYAVLALGPTTPLFWLYIRLPPGAATLRYPHRLLWISGFSLSILTAFALDGLQEWRDRSAVRWSAAIVAGTAAACLWALAPSGLRVVEAVALAAGLAAVLATQLRRGLRRAAAWIVVAALALNVVGVPLHYVGALLASVDAYWRHAAAFAALDPPLTAQDRVLLMSRISSLSDLSLMQKTATILHVPDIYDYEALLTQRHVEYHALMWHGGSMSTLDELTTPSVRAGFRRRMLDLMAVRNVIGTSTTDPGAIGLELPRVAVHDAGLHVYRNDTVLPRARYVPRVAVVREPHVLLNRLAYGSDDLAELALVEEAPPSGFTGSAAAGATGTVRFVTDDPEHLVLDVDAPARGFLVLADQYYPGWRASVDGAPVPILQANYMFRLIEVPAGHSRVEFRYRPTSVLLGAALSALTLAVLVGLWRGRPARPRAARPG